jgi:hypothetical protein
MSNDEQDVDHNMLAYTEQFIHESVRNLGGRAKISDLVTVLKANPRTDSEPRYHIDRLKDTGLIEELGDDKVELTENSKFYHEKFDDWPRGASDGAEKTHQFIRGLGGEASLDELETVLKADSRFDSDNLKDIIWELETFEVIERIGGDKVKITEK